MLNGLTRRTALRSLLAGAAGTLTARPAAAETAAKPIAAATQPAGVCVLFPQAVEGPYYFDPHMVRDDITEGRPGAPLKLGLQFVELGTCTPLANVRIDIWHADAGGIYSGYAGQGDHRDVSTTGATYLRGTQMTNADGRIAFKTVFPGWYPGRTPHVHVKAFLGDTEMLTGQMYFHNELCERVYREREPYKSRPVADTNNGHDFIFREGEREGGGTVLTIAEADGTLSATLIIAVDRSGKAARGPSWGSRIRRWFGGRE